MCLPITKSTRHEIHKPARICSIFQAKELADVEISVQKKRDVIAMSKGVCHKDLGKFGETKSFMTGCLYN
jgi:hypothetical protein